MLVASAAWLGVPPAAAQAYREVTGPCNLQFPRDHGVHPDYRTEWWYYTGNLAGENGRRLGYQLTVFRNRLAPHGDGREQPRLASAWRTHQIYMGHLAVSDLTGGRHRFADRMVRGAVGLAGATQHGATVTVRVADWTVAIAPGQHRLAADDGPLGLALVLEPLKPLVRHGVDGYSRKGPDAGQASCYISYTRLATSGRLTVDGRPYTVSGLSWMDHEFSTAMLPPGTAGWDWFSLQLSDGRDLMVFRLRPADGAAAGEWTAGTLVAADGAHQALAPGKITIQPLSWWQSPHSGARYPVRWRLTLSDPAVELQLHTRLADQEMRPEGSVAVVYWEGSIEVQGTFADQPVAGSGYAELTGYAHAMDGFFSPSEPHETAASQPPVPKRGKNP